MVTAAAFTVACLPCRPVAASHYIHEIFGFWGLIRGSWYLGAIIDFPPIFSDVKFRWSLLDGRFGEYSLQMSAQDVHEEIFICWWQRLDVEQLSSLLCVYVVPRLTYSIVVSCF